MLNCCLFNCYSFIENKYTFIKISLDYTSGNAGGVVGNVDISGLYGAYLGVIEE